MPPVKEDILWWTEEDHRLLKFVGVGTCIFRRVRYEHPL